MSGPITAHLALPRLVVEADLVEEVVGDLEAAAEQLAVAQGDAQFAVRVQHRRHRGLVRGGPVPEAEISFRGSDATKTVCSQYLTSEWQPPSCAVGRPAHPARVRVRVPWPCPRVRGPRGRGWWRPAPAPCHRPHRT